MSNKVHVAGVGMIPFRKPSQSEDWDKMAEAAVRLALEDSGLEYKAVQQAFAGYVYGDSTAGQSALYRVGVTGIPVINVNNNCSTGSTALYMARQIVEAGAVDCALAFGFEQMMPGAIRPVFTDRKMAMEQHSALQLELQGYDQEAPPACQSFGGAGREYQQKYGIKDETFAMIAVKAREHASRNPMAVFREPLTLEEVMASKKLYGPITRFQACPPTCGAAAAVLVSASFAKRQGLDCRVTIEAQSMKTDLPSSFQERSMIKLIGYDMAKTAAQEVYEAAGVGPQDIRVVELHDCFTPNELLTYESLGLCPEGGAEKFIHDRDNTYGGRVVTNPSGGLLSKGHPLGATGMAQCFELVQQLRGTAGERQVEGISHALQHNLGLGGACVVTLYGRG